MNEKNELTMKKDNHIKLSNFLRRIGEIIGSKERKIRKNQKMS